MTATLPEVVSSPSLAIDDGAEQTWKRDQDIEQQHNWHAEGIGVRLQNLPKADV